MSPRESIDLNPKFIRAIVRKPGRSLGQGITTADLGAPEYEKAVWQFALYVQVLEDCGLIVTVLDPLEDFPDAHFVEDTAVVVPEIAVLCRPGADSRRNESRYMEPALKHFPEFCRIEEPGTLDGGDVLLVGRNFLIGLSERTNESGAEQLSVAVQEHGYTSATVPVAAGLHFKSSVNHVGDGVLLVSKDFFGHVALAEYEQILADEGEEYACNTLLLNERLLMPSGYPMTRRKLESLGRPVHIVNTSEFRKMDGGLTCLSLRY